MTTTDEMISSLLAMEGDVKNVPNHYSVLRFVSPIQKWDVFALEREFSRGSERNERRM